MRALEVRPAAWIDSAPIRTSATLEMSVPPEAVWAELVDHESWPAWFPLLDSAQVTGAASGVGGSRRVTVRRVPFDETFTVWDEPRELAWAVTSSGLPILAAMAEKVRLEPTGTGCRVTYAQGLEARRGFGRALRAIWMRNEPAFQQALEGLEARVQS